MLLSQHLNASAEAINASSKGTGAAIAIVLSSDGQPVDGKWSGKMQPGVLLAYTSTVANTLLGLAFAEASVIGFWSRAVKGKMPITTLHYNWAGTTGVVGARKALRGAKAVRVSLGKRNHSIFLPTLSFCLPPPS